jgi:hypothetical protein
MYVPLQEVPVAHVPPCASILFNLHIVSSYGVNQLNPVAIIWKNWLHTQIHHLEFWMLFLWPA